MARLLSPEDAAKLRTYERERHNELAEGYIGFFAPVTALAIAPLLEAVKVSDGMKLLDVPTGSGALAQEATRRGATVIGVDIASAMIAQARKRHPGIDFQVADVKHLPVPDGVLDAVVCAFGLGHFPYPEASLAECLRTLKPGGRIAFSWWDTSDEQRVQGLIRDAVAEVGARPPDVLPAGHSSLRFTDANEFRRLLEGAGLADISLTEHRATHLVAAASDPRRHGAEGGSLQNGEGSGAAGRLQSWSWTEAELSALSRMAALWRSGATVP